MRLINADKLLARYKARCEGCKETKNYCEHCCDIADILNDIEDAPTIEERKKGKWMTKSTFMPDHYGGYYIDQYVCTNCESECFKPSKFCPNCGADMREEKTDD